MAKHGRFHMMMRVAEKQILEHALEFTGSVAGAAEFLELDKSGLYKRLKNHGIPRPRGRDGGDDDDDADNDNQDIDSEPIEAGEEQNP